MFSGQEVVTLLNRMGISHVVWVPDSTMGRWEQALEADDSLHLVRVCREGEAWALAGGLSLSGAHPLVMIQCTGFFESGDALRNMLHDYRLPLFAWLGYRSYHNQSTLPGDTARLFTEPLLKAWQIDYRLIDQPEKRELIVEHYRHCGQQGRPGAALIAEGKA